MDESDPQHDPVIRITDEEVAAARLAPVRPVLGPQAPPPPPAPRLDHLAAASAILALIGIPLVGILIGPIAAVCGALALSRAEGNRRDTRFAVAGLSIGILEFIGWTVGLILLLSRPAPAPVEPEADVPSFATRPALGIADAPPRIRKALQANVRIECRGPHGGEGAGIVVSQGDDGVWIATNRHVVRCATVGEAFSLEVFASSGEKRAAQIRWLAPDGIDLALVHAGPLTGVQVVSLRRQTARVGDTIFVVGNPLGLAATYTAGIVSALRTTDPSGHPVRVLQVQASVNPGNSGGGVYNDAGELLGIVTWSTEKRVGEGIGFAISVVDLLDLVENADGLSTQISGLHTASHGGPP